MTTTVYKLRAFVVTSFTEATSYKLSFLLSYSHILFQVLIYYFIAQILKASTTSYLADYGGDYFAFALIGHAFAEYFSQALKGVSTYIRKAQTTGTLEALLVTQTEIPTLIIGSTLYGYVSTSINVLIYLVLGSLFGLRMHLANLPLALLIMLLTVISFNSLGIISASFIIVFKKGDPVEKLVSSVTRLLGGVYYPVSVMPRWMQTLAAFLPMSHSLDAIRRVLLLNYTLADVMPDILALIAFSVVLLPIGLVSFRYAVRRAKIDGSLTHY